MARSKRKTTGGGGTAARVPGGEPVAVARWLPAVLLAVTTLLLFRQFVFTQRMLYGGDTLSLGYMARDFYANSLKNGVFPRWDPPILGGIPFLDALGAGDSLYPTALLLLVMPTFRALGWKLVLHVFAAGLFMFGWVRSLGRSRAAALLSGLAYGVAPFLVTLVYPGHDGKLFVTALTPLLFWAMERTFARPGLRPYVLVSLVVALVVLTTHFQLAYFLFGSAGAYYLFRCWTLWRGGEEGEPAEDGEPTEAGESAQPSEVAGAGAVGGSEAEGGAKNGPPPRASSPSPALAKLGLFLAASILGASLAAVQLVPAFRYVHDFSRRTSTTTAAGPDVNRVYASSWGLHPEELMSYVVPEFAGNDAGGASWAQSSYWGRNYFKNNHEYAGWVVLLLALVGFFGTPRRRLRWFLAVLGTLALLYALGEHTPVWGLAYTLLPGVSLFRAPSMVSYLFGFSAITLMAFGVDRILELARGGVGKGGGDGAGPLVMTLWVVTGVVALAMMLAAGGALFSFWTSVVDPGIDPSKVAILDAQRPFIVRGFFVATVLAALTAGVVAVARKGLLKPLGVVVVLGVLVFLDGFRVSAPFVQTMDFYQWSQPDPLVQELQQRQAAEPPFRVASMEGQGQDVRPAMQGLELATGHHPNDLARYRELIGMVGSSMPQNILDPNILAVLNVRYLIWPEQVGLPSLPEGYGGSTLVARTRRGQQPYQSLYEFPTLPRARLVAAARVVPDSLAVATIRSQDFDPAREAVLAEDPPLELGGGPVAGDVTWQERGVNRMRLSVTSDRNALLVIADNWYPAWHATVDGAEAPVLRAYYTLRAVPVGPGEHVVELHYHSRVLRGSLGISLVTALLLAGVATASTLERRRGRTDDTD